MSRGILLFTALLLSGCGDPYRCVDGMLYGRIGVTDAWILKNIPCKEIKP
jgi:hypothetical protein